ncbi:MAG TPA: HlyD family type I secretion periplasmic adaptor subunit [Hyphomicrobiaceae bacterium]|nr:HlyD family type I secretion periplasmic adaptor subunit [Hyphomicrobiaceae bacterium]
MTAAPALPLPSPVAAIPSAVSADLLARPERAWTCLMGALVALVGTFIGWAAIATVQEVTTGRGRIIPASKIQVVQSLEAGIVREILVREGALVREGDVILRIDPTIAGSSLGEVREKMLGLRAIIARLEAEVEDRPVVFPAELAEQRPDIVTSQRDQYEARRRELVGSLGALDGQVRQRTQEIAEAEARLVTLRRALEIAGEELEMIRPLEKTRAASRSELLAAEAKVNDIRGSLKATELAIPRLQAALEEARGRRAERIEAARGEALQKLTSARVDLAALAEASRGNEDRLGRTTVKAPASGIIKTVNVTTVGQVIQPGHSVIEIVPMDSQLLVEVQVRPQDIAFLRPGQAALVRLTAYDFAIYGGLKAKVEQIGADSVTTEKGESFYVVRVRAETAHLRHSGEVLPLIPGMVADVDVITGSKTVLAYLVNPLTRMRHTALRER